MMKWSHIYAPASVEPLQILQIDAVCLEDTRRFAVVDGKQQKVKSGCWMFFLPGLHAKLFHANRGMTDCIHKSRPDADTLSRHDIVLGCYTSDDWCRALATPLYRRLAEVWLVSARLWQAGLGPQPLGVCRVARYTRNGQELGPTCGLLTQDVRQLPRKLRCRVDHVRAAGVIPDRIESCVRQQIRGYVTDLCSVVGCMPADAEIEVASLARALAADTPDRILLQMLRDRLV